MTDKAEIPYRNGRDERKSRKEIQCWKCKGYGHIAKDKKCPQSTQDLTFKQRMRWDHEDPMKMYIAERKKQEQEERLEQLRSLVFSSSDVESSEEEYKSRKRKRKTKHSHHKKRKKKSSTSDSEEESKYKHKKRRKCEKSDKLYKEKHKHKKSHKEHKHRKRK